MSFLIEADPIPLVEDVNGVVRVGETRVTLDTVVLAFQEGATAEEIVHQYPALDLADVYRVISYYLYRRADVEVYLRERAEMADRVHQENENHFDPQGMRDRLLSRRLA
jgi:uncharacterized protein (DUF433 family)